jgi:uncharacterized protein (DUF2164 family)
MDILTKQQREKNCIAIIAYFLDEREEEIGVIAAEDLLDFFLQSAGLDIYNKAIEDTRKAIKDDFEQIDYKLSELRKAS